MTFRPTRSPPSRLLRSLPLLALLVAAAPSALAQVRTGDRVAAESLFAEGRQLLLAGDYERACAKLEASQRLEPGLGTSLNLGDCYEKVGRTASAWAEFKSAAAEAQKRGDDLRKRTALERAAALEPRLSRLRIELAEPNVSVLSNGEPVSLAVLGSAIPVDPGSYRVEASAPGKIGWSNTVHVSGAGAVVSVSIPPLGDDFEEQTNPPLLGSPESASLSQYPPSEPPPMTDVSGGAPRTLAWVLGGVGVASLVTGTIFGALAASSWSKAKDNCDDYPYECSAVGLDHADTAGTRATLATIGVVVGAAALGTSVVLFVVDSDDPESPAVAIGPGSLRLGGSF